MKKIIVYGSQYGTTKAYAEKLSQITGLKAVSFDEIKTLSGYQTVVYFGGLYAGGVKGLKSTIKRLPAAVTLIVATVGLADTSNLQNQNNIREALRRQIPAEIYRKAKIFHLRGGIDYGKLSFKHKTMMSLLYRSIKKLPAEKQSEENKAIMETYNQKVNFVDFRTLNPIVEALQ